MRPTRSRGLLLLLLLLPLFLSAQNPSPLEFKGYVKNLQTFLFTDQKNTLLSTGLLHNRLSLNWQIDTLLGVHAEVRNRLFYGDLVRFTPGFAAELEKDPGFFDLSADVFERSAMVLHTTADRLYLEYRPGKWRLRAGRQRVNWGIATSWNPNDLFNAYNFLDFDYEERPGSDALRAEYQLSGFSHVETVFSPSRMPGRWTGAARYTGHAGGYDWQLIGGFFKRQLAFGGGWAGALGNTGFKGEWTLFQPVDSGRTALGLTLGSEYLFGKSWMLTGSVLLNTRARGGVQNPETLATATLSPDDLFPAKFSLLAGVAREITPLIGANLSALYAPDAKMLIALPSFTASVADNWNADLTGQFFFGKSEKGNFGNRFNAVFLRWRWSF